MKHKYLFLNFSFVLLAAILSLGFVLRKSDEVNVSYDSIPSKFTIKTEHISYLKSGLKVTLPSSKINQNPVGASKQTTVKIENEKLLTDVSIYPNPITDKLYLTYNVKKSTSVSIKIMDVLGNDVITLMAQRVEAGEQRNTFQINNKLSSGFYFVRMIVGTESVIKRISVL